MTQPLLTPHDRRVKAMLLRARIRIAGRRSCTRSQLTLRIDRRDWQQKGFSALHNERCVTFESQPMFL